MAYWTPNSILRTESNLLLVNALAESEHNNKPLNKALNDALDYGYRFYMVEQDKGRCYYIRKVITIPAWTLQKTESYQAWYFCHELSHYLAYANTGCTGHGKEFMNELLRICPKESIHFETYYKPQNARSCGISESMHVNCGTVPLDF